MFILFLFFTIISGNFYLTTAQNDFWKVKCGASTYEKNSSYKRELDDILNGFAQRTNNGYGYFTSTFRNGKVTALCRGDIELESCNRCVDDATRMLRRVCPNQKEAAGWYDTCYLWYSGSSIGMEQFKVHEWGTNKTVASSYRQPGHTPVLLDSLRKEAAEGGSYRKYASGNSTAPGSPSIFGIMQCTPDLPSKECNDCLVKAGENFIHFNKVPEARVYLTSCLIWFQQNKFFNSTWFPPPAPSRKSKSTKVGVIVGPISTMIMVIVGIFLFQWYQKRKGRDPSLLESQVGSNDGSIEGSTNDDDNEEINSFSLRTIKVATNNFSLENKLGEGGFGPVYRGILEDGKEIAVKRLSENSGQGFVEFKTEVQLIIKLQHKNLVRLLGYCVKGHERLLIYEFMANNSLDTILFDDYRCKELDWAKRARIAIGIAKGLQYLHEDSCLRIIHRDMKTSNVLLDEDMNSKISDFGTARIFGGNQTEAATNKIIGTYGCMAPEYAMEGIFSTKSDVYSFGVILLEIISGQRNTRFYYQDQPQNLLSIAWNLWKEGKGDRLIDPRLVEDLPIDHVLRWINVALLCVQEDPQDRPTMSTIVFMLEGQWSTSLPSPSEPLSIDKFSLCSEQSITIGAHPSLDLTDSSTTS